MNNRERTDTEFVGHVDSAEIQLTSNGTRVLSITGWLVHNRFELHSLLFSLGEKSSAYGELTTRPDVTHWLPDIPHANKSGYKVQIPVDESFQDTHATLALTVTLSNGAVTYCPLEVHIKKQPGTDPSHVSPYGDLQAAQVLNSLWNVHFQIFLAGRERILFTAEDSPLISVILVLHNQAHMTYMCIKSLVEQQSCGIEVIIIDNGSHDSTSALLSRVHGARIIRNTENVHYIEGANQGAQEARGEYLLFLNNDVVLFPETLRAALKVYRNESRVGAVGAKLLRPDGRLQEAGSTILPDGSTFGNLVGADPFSPEANIRREVDYCSGAFLMTPRQLFIDLRMFDTAYKPAYYEDVDYCIKLREYGYRVLYEPLAAALHMQHGSSPQRSSAQSLMTRNRELFLQRHRSILQPTEYSRSSSPKSSVIKRVLFIDDMSPNPSKGQGYPRTSEILQYLHARSLPVSFGTLNKPGQINRADLEKFSNIDECIDFTTESLATLLRSKGAEYSHLFVSRPTNMEIIADLRAREPILFKDTKVIFDSEALFAIRDIKRKELADGIVFSKEEIQSVIALETRVARGADTILTVSEAERVLYSKAGYNHIYTLSHSIKPSVSPKSFEGRRGVISLGPLINESSPNTDALRYFIREILPLIKDPEILSSIQFGGLIGTSPLPHHPNVTLTGVVDNTQSFYDSARVFIAPTRFGSGIPLKIIEAASAGIPCVVSELVAEQLGWIDNQEYLVGRTPLEFATKIERIYHDALLWSNVQHNALQRVATDYNSSQFTSTLDRIFEINSN